MDVKRQNQVSPHDKEKDQLDDKLYDKIETLCHVDNLTISNEVPPMQQFLDIWFPPTAGTPRMLMEKIHSIVHLYLVQGHTEAKVISTFPDHFLPLFLVHSFLVQILYGRKGLAHGRPNDQQCRLSQH